MPFTTLPQRSSGGLEGYVASMPMPLTVAILDSQDEKEGRTTAIVVHPFRYTHLASGAEIDVPEGYITDFASIPAAVRGMFPPFGRHAKAAVLHDWLYLVGEPGQRPFADRIFLDAMADLGVSAWRRGIMYRAVRLGGGGGYGREYKVWENAFGDWKTGDRAKHQAARDAYYQAKWKTPPRPDFKP